MKKLKRSDATPRSTKTDKLILYTLVFVTRAVLYAVDERIRTHALLNVMTGQDSRRLLSLRMRSFSRSKITSRRVMGNSSQSAGRYRWKVPPFDKITRLLPALWALTQSDLTPLCMMITSKVWSGSVFDDPYIHWNSVASVLVKREHPQKHGFKNTSVRFMQVLEAGMTSWEKLFLFFPSSAVMREKFQQAANQSVPLFIAARLLYRYSSGESYPEDLILHAIVQLRLLG